MVSRQHMPNLGGKRRSVLGIGGGSSALIIIIFALIITAPSPQLHVTGSRGGNDGFGSNKNNNNSNSSSSNNNIYPQPHPHQQHHRHHPHHDIVVIKPTFTSAAYRYNGFYDYYRGICSAKCLIVKLNSRQPIDSMGYTGSGNAMKMLMERGIADVVTDQRVTSNPSILADYRKVIVLHNEYVTQAEFDAITHLPNVLYLYPNALYALVSYNPKDATITLERGHGFGGVNNAFGWGPSMSTKNEYDASCENWQLFTVPNGVMLNCYPEYHLVHDEKLWAAIKN